MHKKTFLFFLIIVTITACQIMPQSNNNENEIIPTGETTQPPESTSTKMKPTTGPTLTPQPIDFESIYTEQFGEVVLKTWLPTPYIPELDSLPINISAISNPAVIQGLTAQQKTFLSQNGFVVLNTGDLQFRDIANSTARENGQPYYMTTDAAYHGLHVTFDELLASLEAEYMRPVLWHLLQGEYEQVLTYMEQAKGTDMEADVQLSLDYLAVAIKLLYPEKELDQATETRIAPQIDQIMSYSGKAYSVLIPNFQDDYGAYRPVGHYAGKPELETYFHTMTWFGRVAFKFQDGDEPGLTPSRAPLIMTLALNEASLGGSPLYETWLDMHRLIDFMIGPSDDPGPMELNTLMTEVYGEDITFTDLMNDQKWQEFLNQVDKLPAPQINSTFASFSFVQEQSRDWRFMGQVFTLDGFIFQNLVFDKVGTMVNPRSFPSGLDVAAAFGSQTAYQLQDQYGETDYENYDSQMLLMQDTVRQQPEGQWTNRFYSSWLYAFLPQLAEKNDYFPPLMNSNAWTYKEMNSMLGSWAELKHDTVLYAKMPEGLGGGGPPSSGPAPSYVEPNPQVFYRLSYAAKMLHNKLYPITQYWYNLDYYEWPSGGAAVGFHDNYRFLNNLADRFSTLGDIAVKELNHEEIDKEDMWNIYGCITLKECMDLEDDYHESPKPDPIPVIAAVAGAGDSVLEAGVGQLNRIYIAVPLEGKLQIAQGGVFTYYEFTQPREQRLTDEAWRDMLEKNQATLPEWISAFVLPGGSVHNETAFRIGDVYIITEAGGEPPVNQRVEPSTNAEIINQFERGMYIRIINGPVINAEGTWWEVVNGFNMRREEDEMESGWVLQNPDWFERAYGQ
ncbi:MAG: DUF3160 domain-containing protein [Anaerolineaceae bacterium]|nr:DUF3160 domain-containing protein [Anaerolineaceae bacterium]